MKYKERRVVGVLASQFKEQADGRGDDSGEVIALRAGDVDSGLDGYGLDDLHTISDVPVEAEFLESVANVFIPVPVATAMDGQDTKKPDTLPDLKQQFTALTTNATIWKPTEKLYNNKVAMGVETNRAEAHSKADVAGEKIDNIREQADDLTKRMDALESQNDGPGDTKQPGGLGSFVGNELKGAAVTAAVTAVNPAAGAALAAVQMVAMMGRGSFGVMNQGEFASARVDRKGHVVDSGYGRGESAPQTGSLSASAPQSQSMFQKMGVGPGFGRPGAMMETMDLDEGRVGLSGAGLRDVTRINIEETPAMKAYESMRLDGVNVTKLHEQRLQHGVAGGVDNLSKALTMGVDDPALRGQTMRLSGAMM